VEEFDHQDATFSNIALTELEGANNPNVQAQNED